MAVTTGFSVEPIEGQDYEGRQWGWRVMRGGKEILRCVTGGTGPCWNVTQAGHFTIEDGEPVEDEFHVCELEELIAALTALRDSDAHKQNVKRWSGHC